MEILCYAFSTAVICAIIGVYCLWQISYKANDEVSNKANLGKVRALGVLLVLIAFLSAAFFLALVRRGRLNLSSEGPSQYEESLALPPPPPPMPFS